MKARFKDIWIFVEHREGIIDQKTLGLIAEARRMIREFNGKGRVTAVALGSGLKAAIESLGVYGADRVLYVESDFLNQYHGELFAEVLYRMVRKHAPSYFLMAQGSESADLSSRLAALTETASVTHVVDLTVDGDGKVMITRPMANGYLFEKRIINTPEPIILCFLPAVLNEPEPDPARKAETVMETLDISSYGLKTTIVNVIEATPEELVIEEADIVVSGGRGVGKGEAFHIIHELARIMGGSVGGTRPVIDWQILPFERQIGQTGKTVTPHLIFACGISGANEFTAGMEKSRLVIAVNTDPRARIFRFADLAVIGDVHEVLPLLIDRLKELKES
jgi:electron transfer flavoprotein alpha subunit